MSKLSRDSHALWWRPFAWWLTMFTDTGGAFLSTSVSQIPSHLSTILLCLCSMASPRYPFVCHPFCLFDSKHRQRRAARTVVLVMLPMLFLICTGRL